MFHVPLIIPFTCQVKGLLTLFPDMSFQLSLYCNSPKSCCSCPCLLFHNQPTIVSVHPQPVCVRLLSHHQCLPLPPLRLTFSTMYLCRQLSTEGCKYHKLKNYAWLLIFDSVTQILEICSIHSFSSLSYDRSKASSKVSSPHSAIQSFLFQMRVSSSFFKVIQ
jgi:hypothetical protein